jgi:outer membrane immunogenic protein
MRFKLALLAAVASFGMAQAASAADLPARPVYKAPVMAPAFSWTGFYLGPHIGGAWSTSDWSFPGFGTEASIDSSGFIYGGQVGWNYQFSNRIVIGIEGDFTGTTLDDSVTGCFATAGATCTSKVDWTALLTGRLGYAFDRSLLYVKGGGAWAKFKYETTDPVLGFDSASETRSGWTIGGGWEYAFLPNWSAKVEYNFLDFGDDNVNFATFNENIKNEIHQVKVGLNYRFGTW